MDVVSVTILLSVRRVSQKGCHNVDPSRRLAGTRVGVARWNMFVSCRVNYLGDLILRCLLSTALKRWWKNFFLWHGKA